MANSILMVSPLMAGTKKHAPSQRFGFLSLYVHSPSHDLLTTVQKQQAVLCDSNKKEFLNECCCFMWVLQIARVPRSVAMLVELTLVLNLR